jgi:hypothetical protein
VTFTIPFPHYYLRSAPSSTVQIAGTAEVLDYTDVEGQLSFNKSPFFFKKIMNKLISSSKEKTNEEVVFIKIVPKKRINCFGLGIHMFSFLRYPEQGYYYIEIPPERL